MDPRQIKELLERVRAGELDVEQALQDLRELPFRDLGIATVDHHRALRQGIPEVIFGERKTAEQIARIAQEIMRNGQNVLVTRIDATKGQALSQLLDGFRYVPLAQCGGIELSPIATRSTAPVAVITAGTSDIGVAEEAIETLRFVGLSALKLYDVGVAGLHRFLHRIDELHKVSAAIVVAGMEGALPSVVAGILAVPVIAVPTSVGYGAALFGFTALFSMLTSCASGVVVVNIDSGFGAAMAVHRMAAMQAKTESTTS